jgi:SAM-dependent methyltransferase
MSGDASIHRSRNAQPAQQHRPHVCPWWVGYLLASPIRRLIENPSRLLAPHVRPGMTVLDLGCAMGFFCLPLARMVGPGGRVVCVDVQERMIRSLARRVRRRRLETVIETRVCAPESLGIDDLAGSADLALAFHVLHETPQPAGFLAECFAALRPGGRLLLAEPRGRVSAGDFAATVAEARAAGFELVEEIDHRRSRMVVMAKGEKGEKGTGT